MTDDFEVQSIVRLKLYELLSDPGDGFNATLAQRAAVYGVEPFVIDFEDPRSPNFIMANMQLQDILASSRFKADPAVMILFASTMADRTGSVREKFRLFSGQVQASIHTYFTFPQSNVIHDMELMAEVIGGTFIRIFNRQYVGGQRWGPKIAYNGDISVAPGQITMGADNWQRLIVTQITVSVVTD
jgi:hypothetical protein